MKGQYTKVLEEINKSLGRVEDLVAGDNRYTNLRIDRAQAATGEKLEEINARFDIHSEELTAGRNQLLDMNERIMKLEHPPFEALTKMVSEERAKEIEAGLMNGSDVVVAKHNGRKVVYKNEFTADLIRRIKKIEDWGSSIKDTSIEDREERVFGLDWEDLLRNMLGELEGLKSMSNMANVGEWKRRFMSIIERYREQIKNRR